VAHSSAGGSTLHELRGEGLEIDADADAACDAPFERCGSAPENGTKTPIRAYGRVARVARTDSVVRRASPLSTLGSRWN
jgi:hypothetical protein